MISPTPSLEQRIEQVEKELAQLKQQMQSAHQSESPWWKKFVGTFADDPDFEAAVELGKQYRQSLKPADTDNSP